MNILVLTYRNCHIEWMPKDAAALDFIIDNFDAIECVDEVACAEYATAEGQAESVARVQRAIEATRELNEEMKITRHHVRNCRVCDLPISERLKDLLSGVRTAGQLSEIHCKDLPRGIGKKGIREIRDALNQIGLKLKGE